MKACVLSGTTRDSLISVLLRLYEEYSVDSFVIVGTEKSVYEYSEAVKFADIKVEVKKVLSESDFSKNINTLTEILKDVDIVDVTGGIKAMAGSVGIASEISKKPITYLEGPSDYFKAYYPYVPRPLQKIDLFGSVQKPSKKELKLKENLPKMLDYEDFHKNLAFIFNYLTRNGDYTLRVKLEKASVDTLVNLSTDKNAWDSLEKILHNMGHISINDKYGIDTKEMLQKEKKNPPKNENKSEEDLTLDFLTNIGYYTLYDNEGREAKSLMDNKIVIVDTNFIISYDFVNVNPLLILTVDCVKREVKTKYTEEGNPMGRLAYVKMIHLPNLRIEDYGKDCIIKYEGKVLNQCDSCLTEYVERFPNGLAGKTVYLTRDTKHKNIVENTIVKPIILKADKAKYERGKGYYSFFKTLYLYVIITGSRVEISNDEMRVTLEDYEGSKVSVKYEEREQKQKA